MNDSIKLVVEVVDELNDWLFATDETLEYPFSFSSDGNCEVIEFGEHVLWCSENDEREYIESEDDYEPLLGFVKKQFNAWVDKLQTLKFQI